MSDDIVIKVDHVSKDFILPHEKVTSVKGLFTSVYRKRTKTSEVQHALRDISFEIKKGEFFGIVGRNGSGKSTMLKMLAGIYQPTEGKIWTTGKLVPFIELGVGFNHELTGRENVYLNGAMMGFSEKHVDDMYEDIVAFAELEDFMDQKLKNYSSGMEVRLAFSVAVKAEADILIVDEVLAVGDSDFQRKCYEYFKSLKRNKKTVVFVSHDMSAVREYCDRVVLIEQSEMKAVGNPTNIAGKYEHLFAKELSVEPEFVAENRWGSGVVKAKSIELAKKTLRDKDDELVFTVTLEATGKLKYSKSLMTGFRVLNAAGQCLHEANSWGTRLPMLKPGEECKVTWRCPNIYNDGIYSIGIFINTDNNVSDSWDAATYFQVNKKVHKGVLVELPVKLSVEYKGI